MRTYRVLTAEGKQPIAIKKGFSWPAFFLGPLWAFYKGLWQVGIALAAIQFALGAADRAIGPSDSLLVNLTFITITIASMVGSGHYGNTLLAVKMTNRGYQLRAVTDAKSAAEAVLKGTEAPRYADADEWEKHRYGRAV